MGLLAVLIVVLIRFTLSSPFLTFKFLLIFIDFNKSLFNSTSQSLFPFVSICNRLSL